MSKRIQAVRGMNDILPAQTGYWRYLENVLQQVAASYGYTEIRFPIVEQTILFKRTIGEVTDIVEKEMYTFEDRNGDSLTLRPEGTAGCVRAGIEHGLLYNQIQRLWYKGPMFRHERPQQGRYRQFDQFGVEAFGLAGPDIDVEQVLMTARIWERLGIRDLVSLEINSLGNPASRANYREKLIAYFKKQSEILDEDAKRRLLSNPLRILDSKNPEMKSLIEQAPQMLDDLDEHSREHFNGFCRLLDAAGIQYHINPRIVRGLDYYGLTVYEWVTRHLGAQGTLCAGGRYDSLVEHLGGKPTPAVGFAIGLERVISLLESIYTPHAEAHVYIITVGEPAFLYGMKLVEKLRTLLPKVRFVLNCGEGNFKTQFKRADKSGAVVALIIGDEELAADSVSLKYLREDRPQQLIMEKEVSQALIQVLESKE